MAFSFLAIAMCMQDSDKTARKVAKWIMQIAQMVGLSQNRISKIIGNTNFSEIDNLLSQGRDMDYIAEHYHLDLALDRSLHLEGKANQEKFKELGWGLRTQSCFDGIANNGIVRLGLHENYFINYGYISPFI